MLNETYGPGVPPPAPPRIAEQASAAGVVDALCPGCRQGRLVIFWRGARSRGRDFERAWCWNTS